MSTLQKGNELRDFIAKLFCAAQFREIKTEKRIGSKKVDVYAEKIDMGRVIKIAVECKNYNTTLTKKDISQIISEYAGLKLNKLVDQVYIIAPQGISADAQLLVDEHDFHFFTSNGFMGCLMGFDFYIQGLKSLYKEGGLNSYYMRPTFDCDKDLEEALLKWIRSDDCKPIAILAGYGMGKTSFSKHFSALLGDLYIDRKCSRIPILIRLGEISSEQSLEGLMSKSLTTTFGVLNYNFNLFMELNRAGMFCILLDGFDEMKHTINWDQFKFNIKQLERLLDGNARVVLLGRPSAFMSDMEQSLVIRGVTKIDEKELRTEWADYRKIELDLFSEEKAYEFIEKYINHHATVRNYGSDNKTSFVKNRIREIRSMSFNELIKRPVQAAMIAEIAAHPTNELTTYSRHGLYKTFLDMIIERELCKQTRTNFSSYERRIFIREIAWWLWEKNAASGFLAMDVPTTMLERYMKSKNHTHSDVLRDLISGSILETKLSDRFYFPHRSYQEFLISEYIVNKQWEQHELPLLSHAINEEISNFIRESNNFTLLKEIKPRLALFKGVLNWKLLEVLAWIEWKSIDEVVKHNSSSAITNPWDVIIHFLALSITTQDSEFFGPSIAFAKKLLAVDAVTNNKLVAIMCILIILLSSKFRLADETIKFILGKVLVESIPDMEKILRLPTNKPVAVYKDSPFMWITVKTVNVEQSTSGHNILKVDLHKMLVTVVDLLKGVSQISGLGDLGENIFHIKLDALETLGDELTISKKGGVVIRYFKFHHNKSEVVSVTKKS